MIHNDSPPIGQQRFELNPDHHSTAWLARPQEKNDLADRRHNPHRMLSRDKSLRYQVSSLVLVREFVNS